MMLIRLSLALALAAGVNAVCDIKAMEQTCARHAPNKKDDKDPTKLCHNPCVDAMTKCASDPKFEKMVGKSTAAQMQTLSSMCASGTGHAGDGTCNVLEIPHYAEELHGRKPDCNSDLEKEMFDCVDNPLLKKERQKILTVRAECQHEGNGHAGDGKCDILAIAKYEKQRKETGKDADCGSNEVKEEFDCIDDPTLAHMKDELLALRKLCQTGGGKKGDCLSQIQALGPVMGPGGVCCPKGDDDCNDPKKHDNKPPKTCSAACSKIWLPFMSQCGAAVKNLIRHDGDPSNDKEIPGFDAFTKTCKGSGH